MAQPFRQTGVTLADEDLTPEFQAQQVAKQRAQASTMPSKKELAAMPAKAKAQLREAIAERTAASAARLDVLLSQAENNLKEIQTSIPKTVARAKELEQEATTAAREAVAAERKGDETIAQGVQSGIISYQGLPPALQAAVNQAPQFNYAASDAAVTSLLRSIGVNGIMDAMAQIRALYPEISSDDALMLAKFDPRFNSAYMTRFAGNKLLMDAGFAPLDDKEYLATERAFDKIFTSYELKQFNNRERFAKLIGSRISADELASRVSLAADRVMKGASETRKALSQLYPELTNSDLIAYAIDPVNQLPALQRKVLSAEIGGAALAQNLTIGLQAAPEVESGYTNVRRRGLGVEELMAAGVDLEKARTGFAKVAEVLPTAEKLSAIYGSRLEQFGRREAEQEQFQQLASAKRARQRLSETEIAAFSGEAGVGRTSLTRERFV